MKILVTGANGQLGSELKELYQKKLKRNLIFLGKNDLDITVQKDVDQFFLSNDLDYCINCAAYTFVDGCESNKKLADNVNHYGVRNLANACKNNNVTLIHISTDFVFRGDQNIPYTESHFTDPLNYYGKSKLKGEECIKDIMEEYYIIRTSWLYSSFGNNFLKTIKRLAQSKKDIGVVSDQIGTPTYARDLAKFIFQIIDGKKLCYGLFHFSNEGLASWYDFSQAILEHQNGSFKLFPLTTQEYPLPAKRPVYSVLDKSKIKSVFQTKIPHWRESLRECMDLIQKNK
ncbi:dTDP-4-dehydrorhamnose reductase [Lutimonas zeaxanthinifaciens]|uniref:dTDP-4-dehydrorhamnose reductase n=1 Tax=Lutimonas zeaxanthinifaciens TaxID=3060215 RepID=UPI00265CCB42|nr:dTDP-4-dehydrorhamnose reductase [Lutimonas sp. YSD2104]WKK67342.1 dTDP-4-dehydrorhamnose reductase [Lutimonas sp. YSD2104]